MSDGTSQTPSSTGTEGTAAQPVLGTPTPANGATGAQTAPVLKAGEQAALPLDTKTEKPAEKQIDDAAKKAADDAAAKAADEKKATEAKAALEKSWADFKPTLPKDFKLDDASYKDFVGVAKELGLEPTKAQKLLDFEVKRATAQSKASVEAAEKHFTEQRAGFIERTSKDPDVVGKDGKGLDASARLANKAFERFVDKETLAEMKTLNWDAHPGLFKAFLAIGRAMKDDSISGTSGATAARQPTADERAHAMYPSMRKS